MSDKRKQIGTITTFKALKAYRDFVFGKISAADYAKADVATVTQPLYAEDLVPPEQKED